MIPVAFALLMTPAMALPAADAECHTCVLVVELAEGLADKATNLSRLADTSVTRAQVGNIPKTMHWPGPARLDSDSTVWTHQQKALAQTREAARVAQVAKGTEELAEAAARAAGACAKESACKSVDQPLAAQAGSACAVIAADAGVDLDRILEPVRAVTRALEQGALTCSAIACPGADCSARHIMLEKAAFAEGILSAAAGEIPITANADELISHSGDGSVIDVGPAQEGIATLSGLTAVLTARGLDPIGTQQLASDLAHLERNLSRPAGTGPDASRPRWRQVSARLALAGMRDALGALQLDGRLAQPTAWAQAATRLESALKALMRLEQVRGKRRDGQMSTSECPGVDPRLTQTLFRLRRAVNSAAVCSVRIGCNAQEAIDAGVARAAELSAAPVFEPQLELVKVLEEEVAMTPDIFDAADVMAEPAPQISPDQQTYQQGAAITLDVEIANNRCLATGGHVALVPADEADGAPPASLADVEHGTDTARIAAPTEPSDIQLLFRAPGEGHYSATIYAPTAEGGALLRAVPIRVIKSEPARCDGWTGVWDTEFGRLVTIEGEDGNVSGTYGRAPDVQPGFVFGRASENQLQGVWVSEISTGGARLTLEGEGVFRGSWGLTPRQVTNGGRWSGVCIAQPTDKKSSDDAN
ncbi:MAG: hypothetical protein ACFB0Z_04855 [Candidatus Phaeomarinobacter sp.]